MCGSEASITGMALVRRERTGTSWHDVRMADRPMIVNRGGPRGRIGALILAGRVEGARGAPPGRFVTFPVFGCTYLYGGSGRYRDAAQDVALCAGSLVLVFPGHRHWYGANTARGWDELFLVFDGPIFRAALERGVIGPSSPVFHLDPVTSWVHRVDRFRTRPAPTTAAGRDIEACEVLALVVEMVAASGLPANEPMEPPGPAQWYQRSIELLSADLGEPLPFESVAEAVAMPYGTWRRAFRRRAGISPARYRLLRRIDAADDLLRTTRLTTREIAAALGFTDEQHLNRRFREVHTLTPRQYRDRDVRHLPGT